MLNPLAGYVVATPDEGTTTTKSGLFLPDHMAQKEIAKATVVSVGAGIEHIDAGDTIIFKPYSSTEVQVGSDTFLLIDSMDIIAVVNE